MSDFFNTSTLSAVFGIVVACYILRDIARLIHHIVGDLLRHSKKADSSSR